MKKEPTQMSTPAILTWHEARTWLHALGLGHLHLPRAGKVLHLDQPGGGTWTVARHASGGYAIDGSRDIPPTLVGSWPDRRLQRRRATTDEAL
jgi:hypothetical protein